MEDQKMLKIMNLMKIRIHFFKDMAKHTYFFTDPVYDTQTAEKFLSKLKQPDAVKKSILADLATLFASLTENFDASNISSRCS